MRFCVADVDECADDPCGGHMSCTNKPGGFTCACIEGFIQTDSEASGSGNGMTSCKGKSMLSSHRSFAFSVSGKLPINLRDSMPCVVPCCQKLFKSLSKHHNKPSRDGVFILVSVP